MGQCHPSHSVGTLEHGATGHSCPSWLCCGDEIRQQKEVITNQEERRRAFTCLSRSGPSQMLDPYLAIATQQNELKTITETSS